MWFSGLGSRSAAEALVVAGGVEDEVAEQFARGGVDDADVAVGDEHDDAGSGVFAAEADVVAAAVVAEGDASGLVDLVVADAPVGVVGAVAGMGFGAELVGGGRGDAPGQGAVRALVVGELDERVAQGLELGDGDVFGRRERGSNAASPSAR